MKKYKILLSAFLVFSSFNINMNDELNAKESVVIDEGTAVEHEIPEDVTGSIESGLADGFVQTDSIKLNFEKDNLEGLSLELNAYIFGAHSNGDGTYIVGVARSNYSPASSGTVYDNVYLLLVNKTGKVQKSLDIANGNSKSGTSAIMPPNASNPPVSLPKFEVVGNKVFITYSGKIAGDSIASNKTVVFSTNSNLNGTGNNWTYADSFSGSASVYPYSNVRRVYNNTTKMYENVGKMNLVSNYWSGTNDRTEYKYAIADVVNETQSSDMYLTIRTYSEMSQDEFDQSEIQSNFRNIADITELYNGNTYGVPFASTNVAGKNYRSREISIWNRNGDVLHRYIAPLNTDIKTMYEISNKNEMFFVEGFKYLKKINVDTGVVTTVKEFPYGTNITIEPNVDTIYGTSYSFYGYAGNNTGAFEGYGDGPGAVIGGMDKNFNVVTAAIVVTNPAITMNTIGDGNGNLFTYGNLNSNKTFANEPTASTNSVNGQGWIDKPDYATQGANNNVYFGNMKKIDDYAPAIKVGDAFSLNVDKLTTQKQIETALLTSVEVYDSFELNPKNPNNDGLNATQMKAKLQARVNRNPENLKTPIDWDALGLDTSKVGYNEVKFFVSDSNNQITADSKVVNVINNSTEENGSIAIDASNFHMDLADVATLDDATAKLNASVTAWDMTNGDDLISGVTVDAAELAAIQNAKSEGVFDLTFTVTKGSETVTNTIKVFVGGTYEADSDIVIFAHSFDVLLDDASSYPGASAVAASEAKAYEVSTNTELDVNKITADVTALNAATRVGPYEVELTYSDGTNTVSSTVIANVLNDSVSVGEGDAIGAKNILFDVLEVETFSVDELRAAIIARSGVIAWDTNTGALVGFEFDESVVLAEVGEYSLTFITENGTEKTIVVYVAENPTCDNGCDSVDATEFITAQDFYLAPDEVAALTEEKVIVFGNAKGINLETGDSLILSADYGKIRSAAGSYDVVYKTENGLEKTVKATVGNNLVDNSGVALAADNVIMWDHEIAAFNEDRDAFNEELLVRSNARAWKIEDNSTLLPVTINSDEFDISDLTPYTYDITYTHENTDVEGGELSTEAKLTVKGNNTTVGSEDAIDANDFALISSEVDGLTSDKVISLANARAWSLSDGSKVEITDVDFSLIEAKKGVYDVTFTTSFGTSTTVQAFVGNKNRPTIENGIVVFADDYTKKVSEVAGMSLTDHVEAADASAIDQDTYEELEITHIDVTNVKQKEGKYISEFGVEKTSTTKDGETEIVKADSTVTIVDDSAKTEVPVTGMTYFGSIIAMLILGLIVIARMGYRKIRR